MEPLYIQKSACSRNDKGFAELGSMGPRRHKVYINNTASLRSIPSFNALKGVEGGISITGNAGLATVSGFDAFARAGIITIASNPLLTTLPTFNALESVASINITSNIALTAISFLGDITTIGGILIFGNTLLATVSGFTKLATVTNDLTIVFLFWVEMLP